jgi:membrane protein
MTSSAHGAIRILRDTWQRFREHGDTLAAATSFFMLLSIAPLLVISVGVASLVFSKASARADLFETVRRAASEEVVRVVRRLLAAVEQQDSTLATALAAFLLLWAASRLFVQIQEALNLIWGVRARTRGTREYLQNFAIKHVISLAMVLGCGALLLASLLAHAVLAALDTLAVDTVGAFRVPSALLFLQELSLSFVLLAAGFAVIYRVLPDARVRWSDVWLGALLTAAMMLAGTWLLGLYFTRIAPAWLQGAVGSAAAFILWTYYLAQVFFLGASFTWAWSGRAGDRVQAQERAELAPR